MSEIDAATNSTIRTLCKQGEKLSKLGDYDRAISKYYEALTLLPELHARNQISAWLYTAIGEAYWNMQEYDRAGESFCEAYECPGMSDNANITFRIGQCLTECDDIEHAKEYLTHAVALGGADLFDTADKKYYYVLHPEKQPKPKPEPVPEPTPVYRPEPENERGIDRGLLGEVLAFAGSRRSGDRNEQQSDGFVPVELGQSAQESEPEQVTEPHYTAYNRFTMPPIEQEPEQAEASITAADAAEPTPMEQAEQPIASVQPPLMTAYEAVQQVEGETENQPEQEEKPKKEGFFKRLFGKKSK